MPESDDISTVNEKVLKYQLLLRSILDNRPFFEILTNIRLIPSKDSLWVTAAVGRFRPVGRRHIQTFCFIIIRVVGLVFAEVDISVIFNVVKKNHVPKNDAVTFLPVFEAWLNLEAAAAS